MHECTQKEFKKVIGYILNCQKNIVYAHTYTRKYYRK